MPRIDINAGLSILEKHYGGHGMLLIRGPRKTRSIARSRAICCYALRKCGYSYSFIGRQLNKNHATVLLAERRVENDEKMRLEAEALFADIKRCEIWEQPQIMEVPISNGRYKQTGKWWRFFQEYEAFCQICEHNDVVEVHHIISVKNGGSDHVSNLILLCPTHHQMLHMGLLRINILKPLRRMDGVK